jgi:hypothetical protein
MQPTLQLLREFVKNDHVLGSRISQDEVPELINALRRRLGGAGGELDLSPESLNRLEGQLVNYREELEDRGDALNGEDTIRLIRETAAYLGQVLVVNLKGEWLWRFKNLHAATVAIPTPVETLKNGEIRRSKGRLFAAAVEAAYFWDLVGTPKARGFLWKEYKAMTQRRWAERL